MAEISLSAAERDRFVAFLEREAAACEVAAARLDDEKYDHGRTAGTLRADAATFRRAAARLKESEVLEG